MSPLRKILFALAAALLASAQAQATDATVATIVFLKGELRENGKAVAQGQQVAGGSTLTTGEGARVHLQFADRTVVFLDQNTTFWFADYQDSVDGVWQKRVRFTLEAGALRSITTSVVGQEAPAAAVLHTPQARFSARGTDYMVALVNPAYLSVLSGSIAATNAWGTVIFGQKDFGTVSGPQAQAARAGEESIPNAAKEAFARLTDGTALAAADPAATSAAAAPSSGFDSNTLILLGVGAAVLGLAGGGGGGGASSTTSH